jgi:AAA15 family ATPase/GTPase
MLISFSVKNYRSFKDTASFSMVAAPLSSKNKRINEDNLFALDESLNLLKSAVIYGANASGKSNLIKALAFMQIFVLRSAIAPASEPIPVEGFRLSTETELLPSEFEIIFFCDNKRYRYGFSVDSKKVHKEWLYHVPNRREAQLFMRNAGRFTISKTFKKEGKRLTEKTRENALFLSVVTQFNGPISGSITRWFNRLRTISGLDDTAYQHFTMQQIDNGLLRKDILEFIKRIDLGISDVRLRKDKISKTSFSELIPESLKSMLPEEGLLISVDTFHKKYDSSGARVSYESFDILKHESEGTKKALFLAGPLLQALKSSETLVIDELDSRLHPLITETILGMFNSRVTNPGNAQLIFASHDTNLLKHDKYFRRDQIWFTEKDMYGATDLYSLAEIKVRKDASFQVDYIKGKYGAIPFIGSFNLLLGAESVKSS